MNRTTMIALLAAPALMLAACGDEGTDADATSTEASTQTLATLIARDNNLAELGDLLSDAGLQELFDGNAAYTVLAPTDAAIAGLGETLAGEELRAARVAVIREHILPGYFSVADIEAAIDRAPDGSVEMQTMGGDALTFTRAGNAIAVSAPGGSSATLLPGQLLASNGVAIPVDGLLKTLEPAAQ